MILKLSDAPLTNAESLYFVTLFKNRPYMGLFECIFNAESKYGNANWFLIFFCKLKIFVPLSARDTRVERVQ